MPTALIQLHTPNRQACSSWSTLSGSAVTQIVITSSGTASEQEAQDLYDALLVQVREGGARRETTPCGDTFGPGPQGCWATSHTGAVRRVLVWVADATIAPPSIDPLTATPRYQVVLPLLPAGGNAAGLPPGIAAALARYYQPSQIAVDAMPEVLVASGLGLDGFRIFISYRHADCTTAAEQLFDALSHQQFDVYLDRFRTAAGTNFIERIRFELADKACVLLLDSRDVAKSDWVKGEYATARKYRLGLMAIDLPGGRKTFGRIATRIQLNDPNPGAFDKATQLADAEIDAAVAFVRSNYAVEMSRRLRFQRDLILAVARRAGAACRLRPDGSFDVAGGRKQYVVAATARPPALASMRPVCEAAALAPGATGVLVGSLVSPSHSAGLDIDWLAGKAGSVVVDERRVLKAMKSMAGGTL